MTPRRTSPAPIRAWAIVARNSLRFCVTGITRQDAWTAASVWTDLGKEELEHVGYRCIRVSINPL